MSDAGVRIAAQGKINLALRVLAREVSGYHQLETIFARMGLADEVTVSAGGSARSIDVRGADAGPAERNLAWRAAVAFATRTGWPSGFRIEIEKRIPVGAGLGGGSADGAAVLRALNALAPSPLPQAELLRIAVGLGADVPFLTTELPLALAWGRGERMLPLPGLEPRAVSLLVPPFPVSTLDAFAWLAAARGAQELEETRPGVFAPSLSTWADIEGASGNDFEVPVGRRHPQLGELLDTLRATHGRAVAGMTGSGSTLYVVGVTAGDVAAPPGWAVLQTEVPARVSPPEPM